MFKGLSMQLHRGLDFAQVHESVEDVVLLHSIEKFPSVVVIKVGLQVYSALWWTPEGLSDISYRKTYCEKYYWDLPCIIIHYHPWLLHVESEELLFTQDFKDAHGWAYLLHLWGTECMRKAYCSAVFYWLHVALFFCSAWWQHRGLPWGSQGTSTKAIPCLFLDRAPRRSLWVTSVVRTCAMISRFGALWIIQSSGARGPYWQIMC